MKLLTKAIASKIPGLYETEETKLADKMVHVKFFSPYNGWTWYGVEYDPETRVFFGLVQGFENEWGYFSLEEFEELNKRKGFPVIERDIYFTPGTVRDLGIE